MKRQKPFCLKLYERVRKKLSFREFTIEKVKEIVRQHCEQLGYKVCILNAGYVSEPYLPIRYFMLKVTTEDGTAYLKLFLKDKDRVNAKVTAFAMGVCPVFGAPYITQIGRAYSVSKEEDAILTQYIDKYTKNSKIIA